jgi:hypothetical protein
MKSFLLTFIPATTAFYLEPSLHKSTRLASAIPHKDGVPAVDKISFPLQDFSTKGPDMERAKECAEHFGKCSVHELKELKEGLHRKRIQEVVFGDLNNAVTTAPEDVFQERLLEEELSLQLSLLHDEMPPSYLFTTTMPASFEETDDGNQQEMHQDNVLAAQVKEAEQNHVLEELVEDGALDSLAICALIGLLMLAPQIFLQ